jgi:hypothetical protein
LLTRRQRQMCIRDRLNTAANWAIVGLMLVSLVMNGISRSKKERDLWVPVALLLVASSFIVALG